VAVIVHLHMLRNIYIVYICLVFGKYCFIILKNFYTLAAAVLERIDIMLIKYPPLAVLGRCAPYVSAEGCPTDGSDC
jgi:hypothetical protein